MIYVQRQLEESLLRDAAIRAETAIFGRPEDSANRV